MDLKRIGNIVMNRMKNREQHVSVEVEVEPSYLVSRQLAKNLRPGDKVLGIARDLLKGEIDSIKPMTIQKIESVLAQPRSHYLVFFDDGSQKTWDPLQLLVVERG